MTAVQLVRIATACAWQAADDSRDVEELAAEVAARLVLAEPDDEQHARDVGTWAAREWVRARRRVTSHEVPLRDEL